MGTSIFESCWTRRKWYLAISVYFTALLLVLYYIAEVVLTPKGHSIIAAHEKENKEVVSSIKNLPRKILHRRIVSVETTNLKSSDTLSSHKSTEFLKTWNNSKSPQDAPSLHLKRANTTTIADTSKKRLLNNTEKDHNFENINSSHMRENTGDDIVIMCLIFTTPAQYDRKGLAVKLTWAKRCNYYAFFYSKQNDVNLAGAHALDIPDGREHLTAKTMAAFSFAYNKYKNKVDWYLKADDDTYFIMENLRFLLSDYNASKTFYIGHKSSDFLKHGYNSGGAGYVLSWASVRTLVEQGDGFPDDCHVDGGVEDLDMGRCLATFRIYPEESRDKTKKVRFHPDNPLKLLLGDPNSAYQYTIGNYTFGNYQGIKVLSEESVSFHYLEPGHMYMFDFLLYKLRLHR